MDVRLYAASIPTTTAALVIWQIAVIVVRMFESRYMSVLNVKY